MNDRVFFLLFWSICVKWWLIGWSGGRSCFLIKEKQIRDYGDGTSHTFMDLLLPSSSLAAQYDDNVYISISIYIYIYTFMDLLLPSSFLANAAAQYDDNVIYFHLCFVVNSILRLARGKNHKLKWGRGVLAKSSNNYTLYFILYTLY